LRPAEDIAAARARRPLRFGEGLAVAATAFVVLLWLAGLLLLPALEDATVLTLVIVIPVVPIVALAVLGTALFRRSGQP
jgi:hypothetical protein